MTAEDTGSYTYTVSAGDVLNEDGISTLTLESTTSGSVEIDTTAIGEDVNVVIDMPNAHVETTVVTTGTVTSTTSDTTLVLLNGSSIGELVIKGGNVVAEAGVIITGVDVLTGAQEMDYRYSSEAWEVDNWSNYADTSWYDSEATTFEISTAEQLAGVATLVNGDAVTFSGKTISIADDIDLGGKYWIPIGADLEGDYLWSNGRVFSGIINGNNFSIQNLTSENNGLIMTAVGATIQDVNLVNVDITGDWYIAGIAGIVKDGGIENNITTIDNCYVSGIINARTASGFVSNMTGTYSTSKLVITNSENNASITNSVNEKAAGFVNCVNEGVVEIENCINSGYILNDVSTAIATAGGFVAYSMEGSQTIIEDSTNVGEIEAKSSYSYARAGGIFGIAREGTETAPNIFINCVNTGDIVAESTVNRAQAGGIIGEWQHYNYVENAQSYGDLEAKTTATGYYAYVAGIVCSPNSGDICEIVNPIIGDEIIMTATAADGENKQLVDVLVAGSVGSAQTTITTGNSLTVKSGSSITLTTSDTLTIEEGATLTIEEGATFTSNGILINNGQIINRGDLSTSYYSRWENASSGLVQNYGELSFGNAIGSNCITSNAWLIYLEYYYSWTYVNEGTLEHYEGTIDFVDKSWYNDLDMQYNDYSEKTYYTYSDGTALTISEDTTIDSASIITFESGSSLIIESGKTLTIPLGTKVIMEDGSTFTNNGRITGDGEFIGEMDNINGITISVNDATGISGFSEVTITYGLQTEVLIEIDSSMISDTSINSELLEALLSQASGNGSMVYAFYSTINYNYEDGSYYSSIADRSASWPCMVAAQYNNDGSWVAVNGNGDNETTIQDGIESDCGKEIDELTYGVDYRFILSGTFMASVDVVEGDSNYKETFIYIVQYK